MPAGHPLIEDMPGEIPSTFGISAQAQALGAEVAGGVGAGPTVEGDHPTNLWVGGILLVALIGIVVLHVTGFRFSTDVGVTRG